MEALRTDLFDYDLPEELIASNPPEKRDGGRLLVLDQRTRSWSHRVVVDLPDLVAPGALMVFNDTRVIPARLRAARPTGGAVEVLLVREIDSAPASCTWTALARANKPVRPGQRLVFDGLELEVAGKGRRGEVQINVPLSAAMFREIVMRRGEVPLPPYLRRRPVPEDARRYQTVYARHDGSVAAPTAGLHFTRPLLERLDQAGVERRSVTLHVGPGTFRPVTAKVLDEHEMDTEHYAIPAETISAIGRARDEGRPVIAVGTTVTRALEGAARSSGGLVAGLGSTNIFIKPPDEFRVIDGLLTNFHLPRSTLIALVSALAGRDLILDAYRDAVEQRYRFFSYGDAMLILP